MTFSDVKMLLDAGFSKDEIMTLNQTIADPAPAPAPAPAAAPDPITKQLNDNISKLIKTIQASNLINNTADKLPDLNKEVDSIMESLIRPIKGGNDK